jgi:hypothetical protein
MVNYGNSRKNEIAMKLPGQTLISDGSNVFKKGSDICCFIYYYCFLLFVLYVSHSGKSYHGHVPPLTDEQIVLREQLRKDVTELAGEVWR